LGRWVLASQIYATKCVRVVNLTVPARGTSPRAEDLLSIMNFVHLLMNGVDGLKDSSAVFEVIILPLLLLLRTSKRQGKQMGQSGKR
jgi:hypothetical protein